MPIEDELRLDPPAAHLRGWFLWPPARNSSSACATTAEIVRPEARAFSRTAAASRVGSRTVKLATMGWVQWYNEAYSGHPVEVQANYC